MYLFTELEGHKGENYVNLILKYLLEYSAIFRYEFINYLNIYLKNVNLNILLWFNCKTAEYSLKVNEDEKYFIDLIVTIDNAIIGIENNVGAEFTVNQSEKHLSTIQEYAKTHSKDVGSEVGEYLLLFCHKKRIQEIEKILGENKADIHILSWESLLEHMSQKKKTFVSYFNKKEKSIFHADTVSEYLFENFKLFLHN